MSALPDAAVTGKAESGPWTSRRRLLTALAGGIPDRVPLNTYGLAGRNNRDWYNNRTSYRALIHRQIVSCLSGTVNFESTGPDDRRCLCRVATPGWPEGVMKGRCSPPTQLSIHARAPARKRSVDLRGLECE